LEFPFFHLPHSKLPYFEDLTQLTVIKIYYAKYVPTEIVTILLKPGGYSRKILFGLTISPIN
jgi:hypothetical protein